MDGVKVRQLGAGVNQKGVRDFNERLILSVLQRNGPMPGIDIARRTNLSSQTVSVILRKLEGDGLLERGTPERGKVGKPSVPMALNSKGVFSFGLKLGRRNIKLVLVDFAGQIMASCEETYDYPIPDQVLNFVARAYTDLRRSMRPEERARLCGLSVAMPYELWNWHDLADAPQALLDQWRGFDVQSELSQICDLPISIMNDATAACRAEHIFGRGKEFRDYAYIYIATFIGGGVVLNNSVFEGSQRNSGAFGPMRSVNSDGGEAKLMDLASIHVLEKRLRKAGFNPRDLWDKSDGWVRAAEFVAPWIEDTALEVAKASLMACSVIDFEAVVIDGPFPSDVRAQLIEKVRENLHQQDIRGLIAPMIEEGSIGPDAREIGAACGPMFSQYFLDTLGGLAEIH
ncbi:MAG: ROK family transcriptional regulator [Pseudomonadota bacterium]